MYLWVPVYSVPWFTQEPNNGNDYFVLNGTNELSLIWNYNATGESVQRVSLLYVDESMGSDGYLATKSGGNPLYIYHSGYTGRIHFFDQATFRIDKIIPSDSMQFKCLVNFNIPPVDPNTKPGMFSTVKVIVVVPPSITLKSSTLELNEGETRTLLCVATGNPRPSYKWEKGVAVLQQGTTSNYTISKAKKEDRGRYKCTAEVSAPGLGTYRDSYFVDVMVKFAPQVTRLSSTQTLDDGNDATFSCTAEAYPMPITYHWFKNVAKISSNAEFVINDLGSGSILTVKKISKSSADRYSCSGRNSVGEGQKKSVFLNVRYAPQAVTVTATPPEVKEGKSVTLTCQSDGFPSPSFSWRFNGDTINGALKNEFLVANAEVKDAGNYTCIAANFRGSKQFTRVVNVRYKPTKTTFTTGNVRNTAVQGSTVTLTCIANGFPAPKYIIRRNGTQVIQSGGKYIITNIQLNAEYDTYSCHSFNDEGPGTNETLTITVEIPPRFPATSLSSLNKTENETHTFSCTAEAKPAATMRWMLNSENITRVPLYSISTLVQPIQSSKLFETLSYLKITRITWRQKGLYSCIAYNPAGQQRQSVVLQVRYRPVVQFPKDHPQNHTVAVVETVTFYCKTIGNPPTKRHKWQFNSVDISGESCDNGCSSIQYTKNAVVQQDAGQYSCIGYNDLGYGPPASAELFVKHPPRIKELLQTSYTANETYSVTMVCWAEGVPKPKVTWKKSSTDQIVGYGEVFTIGNTIGRDEGKYTCTAENELGTDSKEVTLNVQTRPLITTSTPMATNVPGAMGEEVRLSCIAAAKPSPQMSWKRELNGDDLSTLDDQKITSISERQNTIEMTVVTSALNERFYCVAVNFLGHDTQMYRIRERGAPDTPQDVELVSVQFPDAKTVSVNVSWMPGYNGGFRQEFSIHYKRKSVGDFTEEYVGNPHSSMYTVRQLRPETEYQFMVQATNERGKSAVSPLTQVMTIGGRCEEQCNNGTKCRYFGKYLCLCEKGKKGAMCTTNENLAMSFKTGFQFRNEEFKPEYEDLKNPITKTFINKIQETILKVFRGSGITYVMITRLRRGSVIADVVLNFDVGVGESEVEAFLRDVTEDGKLSDFEVFEVVDRTVFPEAPFEREGNSKNDVIYALVIGLLVVILVTVVGFFIRKRKIRGQRDRRAEGWAVESSHFKSGIEIERDNENSIHTVPQPPYMELREVPNSQGRMDETSPHSEIHEYAPLLPNTRSWEVSRQGVVIDKMIGQGSFGQVAQGRASQLPWMKGTVTVAIKMLKANAQEMEKKDLLSELEVMKTLKPHPHVIKLLGCVTISDPILVIIEYVPYGDLLGYLRKSRRLNDTYFQDADAKPETNLSSLQLMKISWQIADGMNYLSSRNIIHRDLAARNILVGERETCKVTDFGMARDVHSGNVYERKTEGRIPLKWTAYEAVMYGRYTTKSDVWSFGVVLYEIFTIGGSPYPQKSGRKVMELLGEGYRMPKPNHVAEMLYQLMLNCWQQEPHDRPTFEQLRRELKLMENQHKRLINMKDYDKKLYENVEDLMF
ncbi:uncharacterized protein [Montipora foliosa]|uniref:uncharacterized protein isoform X2 n=1 Tax=Montipora foliosa TaxID=591990 RepID=UPI0035F120B2